MRIAPLLPAATLALLPPAAQAHHPMGGTMPDNLLHGLLSGLGHPILGLDHFAAFIGFGLIVGLSGLPLWLAALLPLALTAGAALHLSGIDLPYAETLILLSLVVIAGTLLAARRMGYLVPALVTLLSAALHGYVLAETIIGAEPTPLVAYLAGMALVQSALMLGLVLLLRRPVLMAAPQATSRAAALFVLLIGGLSLLL